MPKKIIIGFQADQDFKEKLIKAGKKFTLEGISYPLNLSGFCRIATEKLLKEIEGKKGVEI